VPLLESLDNTSRPRMSLLNLIAKRGQGLVSGRDKLLLVRERRPRICCRASRKQKLVQERSLTLVAHCQKICQSF
jgi:hypothetical protein